MGCGGFREPCGVLWGIEGEAAHCGVCSGLSGGAVAGARGLGREPPDDECALCRRGLDPEPDRDGSRQQEPGTDRGLVLTQWRAWPQKQFYLRQHQRRLYHLFGWFAAGIGGEKGAGKCDRGRLYPEQNDSAPGLAGVAVDGTGIHCAENCGRRTAVSDRARLEMEDHLFDIETAAGRAGGEIAVMMGEKDINTARRGEPVVLPFHCVVILLFILLFAVHGKAQNRIPLETFEGTWYVQYTDLKFWLDGKRHSPTLNYQVMQKGKVTGLRDEVKFFQVKRNGDKKKSIVGFDKPDLKGGESAFVWRGKGILVLLSSKWDLLYMSPDGAWALTHFEKTAFTAEGHDVITRAEVMDDQVKKEVQAKLKELGLEKVMERLARQ